MALSARLGALLLLLAVAPAVSAATLHGRGVGLATTTEGPLALASVSLPGGPALFMSTPQPTWALALRPPSGATFVVTPLTAKLRGEATFTGGKLTLSWEPYPAPGGPVTVSCTFAPDPSQPLFHGRIRVDNASACGLTEVQFPCLSLTPTPAPPDQITLVFPRAYGRSWRDPFHAPAGYLVGTQEPYGHWGPEMQFGTLVDEAGRGLYWAAYDGEIIPKRFVIDNPPGAPDIAVKIGQVPVNAAQAGTDYSSPYPVVLGAYTGDWWDAAHLYRTWALRQQWCRLGPLVRRADVPQVVRETDVWLRGHGQYGKEPHLAFARQVREVLGANLGYQFYSWSPKDNWSDPLRWPPEEWFGPLVKQLAAEGVVVTPYLNSLQWDTECPTWPRELEHWRLTDIAGQPIPEVATGGSKPFMICAASPVFRQALVEASVRLVKEMGVAGIYLDQLGGQCGAACYSPAHGHPVGAGSFGADGVRDFCQAIRKATRAVNPQAFLSGETPPECLLDVIDLRLNAYNLWPGWVNLWAAVYGDQVPSYGRTIAWRGPLGEGDNFYASCGNTFVSGVQFARLWPTGNPANVLTAPDLAEVRAYFKQVVALRREARKFLTYGWLQRPVRFQTPVPELTVTDPKQRPMQIASVLATAWAAHDGTLGFVFTNISQAPQTVQWQADLSRHEVAQTGRYRLARLKADGGREDAGELRGSLLERTEEMPVHSAFVLEIAPVK